MQDIISKKSIGERLRSLRLSKQLSQAEASDLLGLSRSHYSQVELGKQFPSYAVLSKVAEVYNKEYEWILHGDLSGSVAVADETVVVDAADQSVSKSRITGMESISVNSQEVLLVKSEDFLMYLKFRDQQSFLYSLPKLYLPFQQLSKGPYRAFHVEGDRPEVLLCDQDIVIGELVSDKLRVVLSRIYIIVLNDQIVIAKIQRYDAEGFFECQSRANQFVSDRIEIESIMEIWEVKLKITFAITKNFGQGESYRSVDHTIRDLTQEISKIRALVDRS
ncbi:helix-turn-helix transcriptional regulator [uncultured Pedobacter sp.]|uniref:helix-turn-helix domain-containing protein n=1 Tax=uncultured Pedobacter sp. TaxID=246139 RepID=UPI0025EB739C|nr:helix-turn-helix transcriptional regulator [uncultured Pedobacter sp.]